MMQNTHRKVAGVIGWPVKHSLSPLLHNYWLQQYKTDGYYIPLAIAPEKIGEALKILPDLGFIGVNVTIPYKEVVITYANELSDSAKKLKAANCLTFTDDNKILADNWDGYGFLQSLEESATGWQEKVNNVLIIGAGGAARAIIGALHEQKDLQISIANRSQDRAIKLLEEFNLNGEIISWSEIDTAANECDLIVNSTSCGMSGKNDLSVEFVKKSKPAIVFDCVYNPIETSFLHSARAAGHNVINGLGMLIHQARPAFARWFGRDPQIDETLRHIVLAKIK